MDLPASTPALTEKDKVVKRGADVGWLGFPALPGADLCFFSGRVSAFLSEAKAYVIDGVAINGVSGGPASYTNWDTESSKWYLKYMGIVSAYIPNRATGEVLPGVAVVRDATQFHDLVERFRSFDEAKSKETPPNETPPTPPVDVAPAETPAKHGHS